MINQKVQKEELLCSVKVVLKNMQKVSKIGQVNLEIVLKNMNILQTMNIAFVKFQNTWPKGLETVALARYTLYNVFNLFKKIL